MKNIFILILILLLLGCSTSQNRKNKDKFTGSYATESYKKRSEGYDWIKIDITKDENQIYTIKIDSRSDIKKPTCQVVMKAKRVSEDTLEDLYEKKPNNFKDTKIYFKVSDTGLEIYTKDFKDRFLLMYFCSGGGSIGGSYYRI